MPELAFSVTGAAPVEHAAVPMLALTLAIESDAPVRSILLDVQVRIAARRRRYDAAAHERLLELFGRASDWGTTLRSLLWTRTTLVVPPFARSTTVELAIPCSYDLEVAANAYFDALGDGDVPLELLFSGSVFASRPGGALEVTRLSWEQEADYRLPVAVWRDTLERHFRGTAWLRVRKDAFDRLAAYRARHALGSWEETLDALLPAVEEVRS